MIDQGNLIVLTPKKRQIPKFLSWEVRKTKLERHLCARSMCSKQVRRDLWWALIHQTTQNGTMTTSGLLKSEKMLGASTAKLADDKFVIDIDMESNTTTESNLSLRSRSFVNRVNDRLRKILDRSSKDATQDIDKRSLILGKFMSSTLEASVFMGKNFSDNFHSIKHTGKDLTMKQMFDKSESW